MTPVISTLIAATSAFAATNIDDILLLTLFFSQVNQSFRVHHIVLGQYLGFTAICLLSFPGFLGGQLIPETWIGLLGFLPLSLGLLRLLKPAEEEEEAELQALAKLSAGIAPSPQLKWLARLLSPATYGVAAVTLANGGDNIAIYVPLFAHSNGFQLGLTLLAFYSLIALWCYLGHLLSQHPVVARLLSRYGNALVPFVLMGLGLYILIEGETYKLVLR